MLNRLLIGWIVYAGIMGFALGGSIVAAYQIPLSQHETSTYTEQSSSEQKAKEKTDEALARYTWWLTLFTGVMAFATVGLGIATVGLYATGEKQIEIAIKAANAADLSARAAVAIELPIMILDPDNGSFGDRFEFGRRTEEFCVMNIGFKNEGRTKAFPIETAFGWTVGNELPAKPVYRWTRPFGMDAIIGPDILQVETVNLWMDLPDGTNQGIRDGNVSLWFYCRLSYLDFMRTKHEAGFCWRRFESFGGGRFVRDETPAYNYRT